MCSCISQIGIHAFFNNVFLYQNIENVSDFVLCYVLNVMVWRWLRLSEKLAHEFSNDLVIFCLRNEK